MQELRKIVQGGVSAALEEEYILIQLDLLFRQLEVSVARCDSEEDRTANFLLLHQARDIMAKSKTQAAESSSKLSRHMPRRFGILTFNLAIQEPKKCLPNTSSMWLRRSLNKFHHYTVFWKSRHTYSQPRSHSIRASLSTDPIHKSLEF